MLEDQKKNCWEFRDLQWRMDIFCLDQIIPSPCSLSFVCICLLCFADFSGLNNFFFCFVVLLRLYQKKSRKNKARVGIILYIVLSWEFQDVVIISRQSKKNKLTGSLYKDGIILPRKEDKVAQTPRTHVQTGLQICNQQNWSI